MRRYKIVSWILLILSIINVTLAAPVVLRAIPHACVNVMDVREDAIPVSRSEKLWGKLSPAMHPRTSPAPSESDYESAPDSPSSYHTATSEFQEASPEIEMSPGEEWSIQSESHRFPDDTSSKNYLASNEGGPGSSRSFSFAAAEPESGSEKSFLSKLASKSKSFFSKLASKAKNFFSELAGKLKFWRPPS